MLFEGLTLWLLLPLGIALGWALGRNLRIGGLGDPEAITGLSHLANEHPDRAIAALTKAVERDPAAAELNLTLGALFRKRGEIDRALKLHESVLALAEARPELRAPALLELGQDCVKAGLLDRAEAHLRECAQDPVFETPAFEHLLPLLEQLSEWHACLDVAQRLESLKGQSLGLVRAHYYCELAEGEGEGKAALALVRRALECDPSCVRASLLLGRLLEQSQSWPEALTAYLRVPEQDARYLPEALPAIERVCTQSGQLESFAGFVDHLEAQHPLESSLWLARAHLLPDGNAQAVYLAGKLAQKPSWRGLTQFLSLPLAQEAGLLSAPVQAFREALATLLQRRPSYRCAHCGFTPSLLFWHCPSCKQWGTVHPAPDTL